MAGGSQSRVLSAQLFKYSQEAERKKESESESERATEREREMRKTQTQTDTGSGRLYALKPAPVMCFLQQGGTS